MTRLYAAFADTARAANPRAKIGQSALARRLNESPQTVKNWEARGISQRGAQRAQAAFGVNATWLLNGTGPVFVMPAEVSTASQPMTLDPDTLHEALSLIVFDEERAGPYPPRAYARRLAELYGRVSADGGRLSTTHTLDFEREVESRRQGDGDEVDGRKAAGRRRR